MKRVSKRLVRTEFVTHHLIKSTSACQAPFTHSTQYSILSRLSNLLSMLLNRIDTKPHPPGALGRATAYRVSPLLIKSAMSGRIRFQCRDLSLENLEKSASLTWTTLASQPWFSLAAISQCESKSTTRLCSIGNDASVSI